MEFPEKNASISHYSYVGSRGTSVMAVHNVALADVLGKQKPKPLSKRMFMLYGCLLVATLNSCINGYDGSVMGSINSYQQYRAYFGFDLNKGTPSTGIVYAIYTIGNIVGSFAAGPASDVKGRRIGMFLGSAIIVVGSIVQATCYNLGGFMAGRFILGFGVALSAIAGPAYISEMAHPAYRGAMTAIYNSFWFIGGIPGTFVPYGTRVIEGTNAWRIPVWLQMVFSGLVLVLCLFLPESPRWLIANDRHEEALDVMATYHGDGERDSPIVQLEYREMCEAISKTGSDKRWWDYRELVNSKEVRYRSMLVLFVAFFSQWSGNGPVSYYQPTMFRLAGVASNDTRLLLQGIQNVVQLFGAILGALLTDKWGRRPQLLVSTALMVFVFVIITALNATNPEGHQSEEEAEFSVQNEAQSKAQVAMIFIFGFIYSCGWTPNQSMYPVEVLRYESRAKGMGMYNFFVNVALFYNTFVTEIAFTRIGWRYYLLFIFWDMFEIVIIYFFFVETKRRTLEELTEIFQSPKPVKTSLRVTEVMVRHGEITGVVENEVK